MKTRGQSLSPWMQTNTGSFGALSSDLSCDVAVIGAGIVGLTTAYMLAREGMSVTVLEMAQIGAGDTGRTTAHFVTAQDNRYGTLLRYHGRDRMSVVVDSLTGCINEVAGIVEAENIDCDFERLPGYLFLDPTHTESHLDRELEATRRAGLKGVTKVASMPLGSVDEGPALVFPDQAQLHITKYLAGLAHAIQHRGGRIFTGTRVTRLEGDRPYTLKTNQGHVVQAKNVVQATNSPLFASKLLFGKMPPYRTYVIAGRVPHGTLQNGLYWDTGFPYHYVRTQKVDDSSDWLIVGGEDHRTGTADDAGQRFERLEQWTSKRFPQWEKSEFRWSGQVLESVDGLASIGPYKKKPGVFFATGDSGMGMTHGTIAGMILTALVQGKDHPWANIYSPNRLRPRALVPMMREGMALTKLFVQKWFTPAGVAPEDLRPGQGTVIKKGKQRLAVSKDAKGTLQTKSAVCPHMGCIVAFNSNEQSWDCPCHGSRYEASGAVINAPTTKNLSKKKLD